MAIPTHQREPAGNSADDANADAPCMRSLLAWRIRLD
jgi:hypothetical protein